MLGFPKNSFIRTTDESKLLIVIFDGGITEVSSMIVADSPFIWYWCIFIAHQKRVLRVNVIFLFNGSMQIFPHKFHNCSALLFCLGKTSFSFVGQVKYVFCRKKLYRKVLCLYIIRTFDCTYYKGS